MKWEHRCSLEWLKARQNFLTASDIYELLPVTATGKPRKIDNMKRLKVLSKKNKHLTEEDCISTGAAARGHILEPYAIEQFNNLTGLNLIHWDDSIITSGLLSANQELAFSPDACNIPQTQGAVVTHACPTMIGEVKCYNVDKHIQLGYTDKESIEERWQIATAMCVCHHIETGYLILFNPNCDYMLFFIEYDRDDLKDEIMVVKQIGKDWIDFLKHEFKAMDHHKMLFGSKSYEDMLMEKVEANMRLKP